MYYTSPWNGRFFVSFENLNLTAANVIAMSLQCPWRQLLLYSHAPSYLF